MGKKDDYQFDYLDDNRRFAIMILLMNIIQGCARCLKLSGIQRIRRNLRTLWRKTKKHTVR